MKKRIFAIMAVLAGAAAGTAVTAVNYHMYRKAKESEREERQNLTTASELYERADVAQEQSYLLQRHIAKFAEFSDLDKEKVMAFARKLAREEKDGPDISDLEQADGETADRKSEEKSESTTPQTTNEEEDKERLMEEYWRRAKKVYGHSDAAYALAKKAKPVYFCNTGHAYISVADAARKTGRSVSYICESCYTPSLMGKESLSASHNGGGVFRYMSQTEYASIPENRIEVVETREKKDNDDFSDDITPAVTQEKDKSKSVSPQETAEDKDEREKLLAEYLRRVESVFGQGKEARMMAASARPIRNTRTGYAYIGIIDASKKTGCASSDIYHSCMSNNMRGDEWCYITQREYAKMPKEKVEVETKEQKAEEEKSDDITPAIPQAQSKNESDTSQAKSESDTPQATTENKPTATQAKSKRKSVTTRKISKKEEKRLMAEYWRRARNVYGNSTRFYGGMWAAKPVRNSQTGYAYISIQDAAKKTGTCATTINRSCAKGGEWCPITNMEYAKMPEEMTEVVTRGKKMEVIE